MAAKVRIKEGINKKERGADTEKVKMIKLNDNNSKQNAKLVHRIIILF